MSDLLTTAQVATLLGKSVPTINRWAAEGILEPTVKLPGATGANVFRRSDVEALLSPSEPEGAA